MPEHFKLEQEIEALARNLHTELEKPERRGIPPKEALREIIEERLRPEGAADQPHGVNREKAEEKGEAAFLPDYVQTMPPAMKLKVERLIDAAWHEGVMKAAKDAEREGPFFLDAFHDALTEKLYDEFKKRGLLK